MAAPIYLPPEYRQAAWVDVNMTDARKWQIQTSECDVTSEMRGFRECAMSQILTSFARIRQ
jgi:hypothetical protein